MNNVLDSWMQLIRTVTRKTYNAAATTMTTLNNVVKLSLMLGIMWIIGATLVAGVCVAATLSVIETLLRRMSPFPSKEDKL